MLGQSLAVAKRPPHQSGTGHINEVAISTAVTSAANGAFVSTTTIDGVPNSVGFDGSWWSFVSDVDCYIIFGDGSGSLGNASSANAYPLAAGIEYNWFIGPKDNAFSVIRKGAVDGTIKRYRSSL